MANILVIDDELKYLEHMDRVLSADGHVVKQARSGASAVEIGERFRPDLLFVDWMLQNSINGVEVIRRLRAFDSEVQAVLITGYPSSTLRSEARDLGDVKILEKPFGADELREAVRALGQA